tara:strand:- start:296 stop:625 length:330 start_codon:yes stop_codon:yes gene_type:complete
MKNFIMGKCPSCKKGKIHITWSRIKENCPVCDFKFQESNGDNWFFLLIIDRALFIFPIIVGYYFQFSPYFLMVMSIFLMFLFLILTPLRVNLSIYARYILEKKLMVNRT